MVGGKDNFFHCDTCKCCLNKDIKGTHKCIKGGLSKDCTICMEKLYSGRGGIHILNCGHAMHSNCLIDLLQNDYLTCPTCKKSIYDSKLFEDMLDYEFETT